MNGSWFDQNFGSISDDFFDQSLNLFDFPPEDVGLNDGIDDWESQFQHLTTPSELLTDFATGLYDQNNKENLKLKKSSYGNEVVQPIQLQAAEASTCRSNPPLYESSGSKYRILFCTTSPVSVLESSSSSSSAENSMIYQPKFDTPVKRPRSKCPRYRRSTFPFISSLHAPKYHPWGYSESESESYLDEEYLAKKKQKKRRNLMLLSSDVEWKKPSSQGSGEIRKCTHCEVTKTPQWREGPMGPKTLCNACGVRYRSGRLFPEYRPAASPTFIPTLHSNSHRKVVEMRKNYKNVDEMAPMNTALPPVHEFF